MGLLLLLDLEGVLEVLGDRVEVLARAPSPLGSPAAGTSDAIGTIKNESMRLFGRTGPTCIRNNSCPIIDLDLDK